MRRTISLCTRVRLELQDGFFYSFLASDFICRHVALSIVVVFDYFAELANLLDFGQLRGSFDYLIGGF